MMVRVDDEEMAHALDEFSYKQFIPEYEIGNVKLKVNHKANRALIPMVRKEFLPV